MLHVSFAMTSEAYADRTKTETRRFWKPIHAAKFRPDVVFMGIDRDFRAGGKRYWPTRGEYIEAMGGPDLVPYVLRFEHLEDTEETP